MNGNILAMDKPAKQKRGGGVTSALLAQEDRLSTPENRNRIWVRFMDIADGDLIVGGGSTSLASLKDRPGPLSSVAMAVTRLVRWQLNTHKTNA